jgi:hypothetical protein
MAIRQRTRLLKIPYISDGFPAGSVKNGSNELIVSWERIVWAALTIGRPTVHHAFQYGSSSYFEAIFRLSLVRMALEQRGSTSSRLRRTTAFVNLDPTEKGAISYFLGMALCKVFSSKRLATPWLLHLDAFQGRINLASLGRSRPDLIGLQTGTRDWLSFEAKGRSSRPGRPDVLRAKSQARRVVSVNGAPCTMHIGAFTYFAGDVLRFHWIDPEAKSKKIEIPEIRNEWRYYYAPVHSLWRSDSEDRNKDGILAIPVPEYDLSLLVHPELEPYFVTQAWATAQQKMFDLTEQLLAEGYEADGLKVLCGPSWRKPRSRDR